MKTRNRLGMLALVSGLIVAGGVSAHHSFTQFDKDTELVQTGTVVRWSFNNPHSWLYLNIPDADGNDVLWSFEGSAPPSLIGRGITGATFEPGDTIKFMYCPMRDGRNGGHLGWVELDDGSFVNPSDGGCNGSDANITQWKEWLDMGYTSNREAGN